MDIWWAVAAAIVTSQLALLAVELYLHRHLAHRSIGLHPVASVSLRAWLALTVGHDAQRWVAVHRTHHRFADVAGDPHSPVLEGTARVLFGSALLYHHAASNLGPDDLPKDVASDSAATKYAKRFIRLPVLLGLFALVLGWEAAAMATVVHTLLVVFLLGAINSLGHSVGYRNWDAPGTNLRPLSLATWGQGFQNNHHAWPRSPKMSTHSGEVDHGWGVVRVLVALRLATLTVTPRTPKAAE